MTARVEAERAMADVLAEHAGWYWDTNADADETWSFCTCGHPLLPMGQEVIEDHHRAHVASVLADLMAERQDEAWEQGRKYGNAEEAQMTVPRLGNPYRPDPKDTRDE